MRTHRSTLLRLFAIAAGVVVGLTVAVVVHAGRNSTGTYSLPSGNPVVNGTLITPTWANGTLSDIGTELTSSLDRNGRGAMLAPLKCVDGTVAAPGLTFGNEPGTGLYRIGSSNPAISVSGVKRQEWTSTGTAINGALNVSGNLSLDKSGEQAVVKTGGTMDVGTNDAQPLVLMTNGVTRMTIAANGAATWAGSDVSMGSHFFTNIGDPASCGLSSCAATKGYVDTADALKAPLASPTFTGTVTAAALSVSGSASFTSKPTAAATSSGDGATTLSTKGYVDGLTDGSGSISWGTNWSGSNVTLRKMPNGLVVLTIIARLSSGSATTVATLPAGYRPSVTVYAGGVKYAVPYSPMAFSINTSGVIAVGESTPATNTDYGFSVVFLGS